MSQDQSSSSALAELMNATTEISNIRNKLKPIKDKISYYERMAEHRIFGQNAKNELQLLYDQQVSLKRRQKCLEKNLDGYRKAKERRSKSSRSSRSSSSSGSSRKSRRSGKSSSQTSRSSTSSAPAENGWWCRCGVLNYTEPDSKFMCWGCNEQTFDESTCFWELEPHPGSIPPWEIDIANPEANADNRPE